MLILAFPTKQFKVEFNVNIVDERTTTGIALFKFIRLRTVVIRSLSFAFIRVILVKCMQLKKNPLINSKNFYNSENLPGVIADSDSLRATGGKQTFSQNSENYVFIKPKS